MKAIILATAAALLTVPAHADVSAGALGAIAHFNQDHDTQDGRITIVSGQRNGLSSRGGFSTAQGHFNSDFDTQDDVRRVSGGTTFSGSPRFAADIIARIRAEGLEDE